MKHVILGAVLAAAALTAAPALAKQNCPPGLAKKDVPCVPPGQAKKGLRADDGHIRTDRDRYIRVGDSWIHEDDLEWLRDYDRYSLPRLGEGEAYYRNGNIVYRVDQETRRVIELLRLADLVFGN